MIWESVFLRLYTLTSSIGSPKSLSLQTGVGPLARKKSYFLSDTFCAKERILNNVILSLFSAYRWDKRSNQTMRRSVGAKAFFPNLGSVCINTSIVLPAACRRHVRASRSCHSSSLKTGTLPPADQGVFFQLRGRNA